MRICLRGIVLLAVLVLSVTGLSVSFMGGCGKHEEAIKIGAVLPLTGSAAVWGQNARMGLEIALQEINQTGGINGTPVVLIFEDSQSEPGKAVSALQKLIAIDKVGIVIGDIASSSVLAMAPIAERAKVLLLSPGASNPKITDAGAYVFRNWQSDALEGDIDARFAVEKLGWKNVAILFVNNAYGSGLKEAFEMSYSNLGGDVVSVESFDQGATDMRAQLGKLSSVRADGIYLPGYPPEMSLVLRQARELGVSVPFLSVQAFDDPQILSTAGAAAEGVIFSVPKPPDASDQIVASFVSKYKSAYHADPGVCSDTGYDALKILAWAIGKVGTDPTAIRDQLYKLQNYPGAAGLTSFDMNGDVIKPFIFKTVRGGAFQEYGR
jgi:branched-chain amino acid transport system substrate-binding protein